MKTITNDPIIIYTIRIPVLDMLVLNGKKIASMIWAKKQIKKTGTVIRMNAMEAHRPITVLDIPPDSPINKLDAISDVNIRETTNPASSCDCCCCSMSRMEGCGSVKNFQILVTIFIVSPQKTDRSSIGNMEFAHKFKFAVAGRGELV